MNRNVSAAIVAVVVLVGCVSTKATRLGTSTDRPAVSAEQVAIYRNAAAVPGKYEEVALLMSKGDHSWTSEEGMHKSMRKKAGDMGANGVILDAVSEPGTGAKVANFLIGTAANREGKAVAIYVLPTEGLTAR